MNPLPRLPVFAIVLSRAAALKGSLFPRLVDEIPSLWLWLPPVQKGRQSLQMQRSSE